MRRKGTRYWVVVDCGDPTHEPTCDPLDGPYRFRWVAQASATSHRAHEAQTARAEHRAMRRIDVLEEL